MVGRHQSNKGINETIKYELDPREINYNDVIKPGENVYILSHQPGIGKTHSLMEWIKQKIENDDSFKYFYFTDRHNSIYEHLDKWNISNASHWEGFERICNNSRMKNLSKYHLSAIDICNQCNKCNTYRNQFKNTNRVFAPFQYLQTNHFKDNYPSVFILDEAIKQYTKYFPDYVKAKNLLNVMGLDELGDLVDNDLKKLLNELSKKSFKDKYKEFIIGLTSNKSSNEKTLQLIEEFNIFNFIQYLKWDNFYSYHLKFYGMPMLYYHAFNAVANGIPAIFMDATFNPFFFHYLLETYNVEGKIHGLTPFTSLKLYHFYKQHQNYNTVLYRLRPENTLPKTSFTNPQYWERTKEWFPSYMKAIMTIFGRNNVGIITFKEFGDKIKSFGFDCEYYGNLRGTNVLKDKPVLVLVGAYLPILTSWDSKKEKVIEKEYYEDIIMKYFLLKIEEENKELLRTIALEAPAGISSKYWYKLAKAKVYTYMGKNIGSGFSPSTIVTSNPAFMVNIIEWFDEFYQGIHRNRGLNDDRIIFSIAWFPERDASIFNVNSDGIPTDRTDSGLYQLKYSIRNEFHIDKIDNDIIDAFFRCLSDIEKGGLLEDALTYVIQHPDVTSSELTELFKVQKPHMKGGKRGGDTKPMTTFLKGVKMLKEQAKRRDID